LAITLLPAVFLFAAVEFLGLEVSQVEDDVLLEWSTASETQNLGFVLERKTDPDSAWAPLADFMHVDALLGQGTVSTTTHYAFRDSLVEDGTEYFYRIAGVDEASNIGYLDSASILVAVTGIPAALPGNFSLSVFPNPFNAGTMVRFRVPAGTRRSTLHLYDTRGKRIAVLYAGNDVRRGEHGLPWDAAGFPSGVYVCRLRCELNTGEVRQGVQKLLLLK
jgi:hypothetical protein